MKDKEEVLTSPGELSRMRILSRYKLLRTLPETLFDDLVCLTAVCLNVSVALVSLTDAPAWQTTSDEALCTAALGREETTVLTEMAAKPLELTNPFVTRALGFRFYAATSLKSAEGETLGSLCVVGRQPRTFSPTERDVLSSLAALVVRLLELRRAPSLGVKTTATLWNQVYAATTDAQHRILALAERLHQQSDLETITAVIQRKLICKDANHIVTTIDEAISSLVEK